MTSFSLQLLDPTQTQCIDNLQSFIAEDASGSFGLLPRHTRFITVLPPGLARYQTQDDTWHYIALSSATLYFADNTLRLSGQRFLLCDDIETIEQVLRETINLEQQNLGNLSHNVRRVEEEMFRRLSQLDEHNREVFP